MVIPAVLKKLLPILALLAIIVAVVSFFGFLADSSRLGGDALNGYIQNGHYFVGSHGSYKEVSQVNWEQDHRWGTAMFILFPFGFLGMGYLVLVHVLPSFMFYGRDADRDATVQEVIGSGQEIVTLPGVSARIGMVNLSFLHITATLYPDGLVIKSIWRTVAIRLSEIRTVTVPRALIRNGVEIYHRSKQVASPIRLNCSPDNAFVTTLQSMVNHEVANGKTSLTLP